MHYTEAKTLMEEVLDLLPLSEDPASLLWLENEVHNLDLFGALLPDAEDDDAVSIASPLTSASIESLDDSSSSSSDLRVGLRFNNLQSLTSSNARAETPVKASAGRASYRQRQKHDIQVLRAHVADLQHELRFLQSKPLKKKEASTSDSNTMLLTPAPSGYSWQSIAKQEFQAREVAEEDNRILRQTLQERIRMAKSLERVLLQHEMIRMTPRPYHPRKLPRNTLAERVKSGPWDSNWITVNSLQEGGMGVFRGLLRRVESAADDTAAIFKSNGLACMTTEFRDARLKISPQNDTGELPAMAVEMLDVKIIPFDLEDTVRVVWRCVSAKRVPISSLTGILWQQFPGLTESEDVVAMRSDEAEMLWHRVMKRIVDTQTGRVLFVWESQMMLKESGTRLRQRGWLQFERQPACSALAKPSTILRSCLYVDPQSEILDSSLNETVLTEHREDFAKIADRILPNFKKAVSITYQTVVTLLTEESQADTAVP